VELLRRMEAQWNSHLETFEDLVVKAEAAKQNREHTGVGSNSTTQEQLMESERQIAMERMQLQEERERLQTLQETQATALAEAREEVARLKQQLSQVNKLGTLSRSEAQLADLSRERLEAEVCCGLCARQLVAWLP